jgi:hypothetical protein
MSGAAGSDGRPLWARAAGSSWPARATRPAPGGVAKAAIPARRRCLRQLVALGGVFAACQAALRGVTKEARMPSNPDRQDAEPPESGRVSPSLAARRMMRLAAAQPFDYGIVIDPDCRLQRVARQAPPPEHLALTDPQRVARRAPPTSSFLRGTASVKSALLVGLVDQTWFIPLTVGRPTIQAGDPHRVS